MAGFLALHDPHHLRTVGEEGFFAYGGQVNANPATWARHTGQDFRSNHDIDAITHTAFRARNATPQLAQAAAVRGVRLVVPNPGCRPADVWPTNWAILGGTSGIAVRKAVVCVCNSVGLILCDTFRVQPTQFVSSWLTAHFTEADRLGKVCLPAPCHASVLSRHADAVGLFIAAAHPRGVRACTAGLYVYHPRSLLQPGAAGHQPGGLWQLLLDLV
jgi:hypothetical protein